MEKEVQEVTSKLSSLISHNVMQVIQGYVLSLIFAIIIFIVGKYFAKKITALVVSLLKKVNTLDETLIKFIENIVYYILMVVVILTTLTKLGIETTSLLAILGAAGLAIGLALKDSLGNFASGVMIILFKPFKVGDVVNAAGVTGSVTEVGIFTSVFTSSDNQKIIIPNGAITQGNITNINANDTRRVDLVVGISYDDDIKKTKEVLKTILENDKRILQEKGLTIAVGELADSSVNFVLRAWVNTVDYWNVKFDLTENIKLRFDEEGISIPFPQQDVHHYNND